MQSHFAQLAKMRPIPNRMVYVGLIAPRLIGVCLKIKLKTNISVAPLCERSPNRVRNKWSEA